MRRGSQSQYQPSNKSALGISKFNGGLDGSALLKTSMPAQKKMQGQDLGRTTKSTFEQTVNKLKSKPNQKVLEDQYISGLQQEIKYLEYELKLLKDKQIMEREGVNELDNFLKDQIPINENILAMKNKYNATKNSLEDQFRLLSTKNIEASDVLETQKQQVVRLHEIIDGHRKQMKGRNEQFKEKLGEIVKQLTLTKHQYDVLSNENKTRNQKMKKMNEDIANIQRNIEKEKVKEVMALEKKSKANEQFQEDSKKTKEEMLETLQKVEQLQLYMKQKGTNPLADELIQKNATLRKKIQVNDNQKSTAHNTIVEIDLFLQEEARQRQIERKQKAKYTLICDQSRLQIQNIERFADNMIKQQTLRTKKLLIKELTHDQREKSEIYELLMDKLRTLQNDCTNLIGEKKELQDHIQGEASKQKEFEKKIKELNQQILDNKCKGQSLARVTKQIIDQIEPLKIQLAKCQGGIPLAEKEIEKRTNMINHLNKQVDLIKQLKSLDLDQLQMISTSGVQMQNTLHEFIRNWEKLKNI